MNCPYCKNALRHPGEQTYSYCCGFYLAFYDFLKDHYRVPAFYREHIKEAEERLYERQAKLKKSGKISAGNDYESESNFCQYQLFMLRLTQKNIEAGRDCESLFRRPINPGVDTVVSDVLNAQKKYEKAAKIGFSKDESIRDVSSLDSEDLTEAVGIFGSVIQQFAGDVQSGKKKGTSFLKALGSLFEQSAEADKKRFEQEKKEMQSEVSSAEQKSEEFDERDAEREALRTKVRTKLKKLYAEKKFLEGQLEEYPDDEELKSKLQDVRNEIQKWEMKLKNL